MGNRGPKPRQRGPIRWTSELAYIVGLIATDGCLSKDGRHITFTSNDLQLIQTFMRCLELKNHIGRKKSGFASTLAYNLQFGNVVLYNWLLEIGLTPAKSKTMGAIAVPRRFFGDFIRGLCDGDGSFYSYYDKRWRSSFMFYLVFTSASKEHISWLQRSLQDYYGVFGHGDKDMNYNRGSYQLKYAKREARKIIKIMYKDVEAPCLERKREKIYNALELDK